MATGTAVVQFHGCNNLADLLGQLPETIFSPKERVHCAARARGLDRWAGRLAAKQAVARLLGVDDSDARVLTAIEVVPDKGELCTDPGRCARGHPARVILHGPHASAERVELSIAHSDGLAVAVAIWRDGSASADDGDAGTSNPE